MRRRSVDCFGIILSSKAEGTADINRLSLWSASPENLFSASIGVVKEVSTALES
jgi:hypothetical protein